MKQYGVIVRRFHGRYTPDSRVTDFVIEAKSKKQARYDAIEIMYSEEYEKLEKEFKEHKITWNNVEVTTKEQLKELAYIYATKCYCYDIDYFE
jgi:hypothetical protein